MKKQKPLTPDELKSRYKAGQDELTKHVIQERKKIINCDENGKAIVDKRGEMFLTRGEPAPAKKVLTTAAVTLTPEEPVYSPSTPGPTTNRPLMSLDYLKQYASETELKTFVKHVQSRVKKTPAKIWRKCDKCGRVIEDDAFKYPEPGSPCIFCNWHRYKQGGHFKNMNQREIKAHLAAEEIKMKDLRQRIKQAEIYRVNTERQKAGLSLLSEEEIEARRQKRQRLF